MKAADRYVTPIKTYCHDTVITTQTG